MAETSSRTPLLVAVIGVIGTLGAALIANWDKLTGHAGPPPAISTEAATPSARLPPPATMPLNLSGSWRDAANPATTSTVVHEGQTMRFTRVGKLSNGVAFESTGTGSVVGTQISTQYAAKFQSGDLSSGQCVGSAAPDGATLILQCTDSLLGRFQSTSLRQ